MTRIPRIAIRTLEVTCLLVGCLATMVWGCGRPPSSLEFVPDAGLDAGTDASTELEPLRRLTTRRLFGTETVRNGVVDPTFSTLDHTNWLPYSLFTGRKTMATTLHLPTPTGMPALRLIPSSGNESTVTGLVRSAAGPVEVSLWCGRSEDAAVVHPLLSLFGLYSAGQAAADFDLDPDTPSVTLEGITWMRYVALLDEGPMGWASLRVVHRSEAPIYLNAPVLAQVPVGDPKLAVRRPRASLRPLTFEEQVELVGFFAQFRDRFGGPYER